jgi:hypothetical protein
MEKAVILVFVAIVLIAGGAAGWFAFLNQNQDTWSPRDYVVTDGGCIVYPQGDPLYDEHYAKNVNTPNCNALEAQENAQYTEMKTEKVRWEINAGKFGLYTIVGVLATIGILFLALLIRG